MFFVNDVPILDIENPASPIPKAILDFSSFGDDNATGVAADSSFVYLTTDRNRMLIGQYLRVEDTEGVPPEVAIVSPIDGSTFIERDSFRVTISATDDFEVRSVDLLMDGAVVNTETSEPYEFDIDVPVGVDTLNIRATAVDIGGNVGTADNVLVNVVPDTQAPAVSIDSPTSTDTIFEGSTLPIIDGSAALRGSETPVVTADGNNAIIGITIQNGDGTGVIVNDLPFVLGDSRIVDTVEEGILIPDTEPNLVTDHYIVLVNSIITDNGFEALTSQRSILKRPIGDFSSRLDLTILYEVNLNEVLCI